MKKLFILIVASFLLVSITACYDSHFIATNESGNKVLVHDVNVGPLFYYPGMALWNSVAGAITAAEFYTCFALFVPIAIMTNDGSFVGYPDLLQKTMGVIVFDNHLPFLPASAIDYELETARRNNSYDFELQQKLK